MCNFHSKFHIQFCSIVCRLRQLYPFFYLLLTTKNHLEAMWVGVLYIWTSVAMVPVDCVYTAWSDWMFAIE